MRAKDPYRVVKFDQGHCYTHGSIGSSRRRVSAGVLGITRTELGWGVDMMGELQAGDPSSIGPYRLLGRLGTGGMGQVFLGRSVGGRLVAVKVIRPDLAQERDFRARFGREVAAARNVNGQFTALVAGADVDGPVPWLATAYVPGPSLSEAVADQGPMSAGAVLMLAAGLAEGLGAIHAAGVVHRDLKPSNVLLAGDGPRVIDFGISRAAEASMLTQVGTVVGSPGFMSPEQAEGDDVGPPSDVFSLGAVLTFAATGAGPFGSGSTPALVYRVVHSDPDIGGLPDELRLLVRRCLAKDPAARPSTDELLAELSASHSAEDWLSESIAQVLASHAPPSFTPLSPIPFRPPGDAPASAAAAQLLPAEVIEVEASPVPVGPAAVGPAGSPAAEVPAASAPSPAAPSSAEDLEDPAGGAPADLVPAGVPADLVPADLVPADLVPADPGRADSGLADDAPTGLVPGGVWSGSGSPGRPAAAPGDDAEHQPRRRRRAWVAAGLAVLIALSVAAALGLRSADHPSSADPAQSPRSAASAPAGLSASPGSRTSPGTGARPAAQATVPVVRGMTLSAASAALGARGFGNITYAANCYGSSDVGHVVRQSPAAGTHLSQSTPVLLYLQAGNCVTVPDVDGMDLSRATTALKKAGFTSVPYQYDCYGFPTAGAVVSQSPSGRTRAATDQPVVLELQAADCS
jgi:serine/threonine protein kinase